MRHSVVLTSLLLTTACLWEGESPNLTGVDTRLTLLHTTDIHSRLFPFDLAPTASDGHFGLVEGNKPFGGVARLGYLVKRERRRADRVLHLDSGDVFQGAPIFNVAMGEPELRFLSVVGVDAVVIGNHEFDAGIDNLGRQLSAWANYPLLAANYVMPDPDDPNNHDLGNIARPFELFNLDGLRVAVIGLANLSSLSSIGEGGNSLQITPLEQNEIVNSYVRLLHDSVDLVVVLSHVGLTEDVDLIRGYEKVVWKDRVHEGWTIQEDLGDGRVVVWVPGVRDVDVVLGGHHHIVLNPPQLIPDPDGREVILAHSGAFSKYLGRLDLVLRDDSERGAGKRIISHKYQVFPVDARLANYEDLVIKEVLQPYLYEMTQALDLGKVIAFAPTTIYRRSQHGNGDSGLGNIVTESMRRRRRVEAELAVTNTLGMRDNFYRGPITLEDMFNVFPFENTVTVMHLSGREMQEMCDFITERSASRGCQSQAQVSGLMFTMNCGQVLVNERDPDAYQHPAEVICIGSLRDGETYPVKEEQGGEVVETCPAGTRPLDLDATYKVATNDYIAKGGSGFKVLKRNTTTYDTGVSLRDALIDYLGTLPACSAYDIAGPRTCMSDDELSQLTCNDIVDCSLYVDACTRGEIDRMPRVCLPAGSTAPCECGVGVEPVGQCGARPEVKGDYADTPCVIGEEDGRLRRKTSGGLDQLEDEPEEYAP